MSPQEKMETQNSPGIGLSVRGHGGRLALQSSVPRGACILSYPHYRVPSPPGPKAKGTRVTAISLGLSGLLHPRGGASL